MLDAVNYEFSTWKTENWISCSPKQLRFLVLASNKACDVVIMMPNAVPKI